MVSIGRLPLLYQCRNEIDSRFISDDIARDELSGHSEAAEAELGRTYLVIVIADIIFSVIFHVMDIHTHVVAEAVRHEQACHARFYHALDITADDIECAETLKHEGHSLDMHVPVCRSRLGEIESQLVAVAHNLVNIPLLCGELAACRICTCEVGSVMHIVLGTGIDYHQLARFYNLVMQMVMQCLAMLCENCGK